MLYWNCNNCGAKGIPTKETKCPYCQAARILTKSEKDNMDYMRKYEESRKEKEERQLAQAKQSAENDRVLAEAFGRGIASELKSGLDMATWKVRRMIKRLFRTVVILGIIALIVWWAYKQGYLWTLIQ